MLQMPEGVRAAARDGKKVEEETQTSVVNAHGGFIKLQMEIQTGQPILLINAKTKMEQSCRVVRVETSVGGQSAVAFEFGPPAPPFLPLVFSPAGWAASLRSDKSTTP